MRFSDEVRVGRSELIRFMFKVKFVEDPLFTKKRKGDRS